MIVKIKYVVFVFLCCHSLVFSMGPVAEYMRNKMRTTDNYQSLLSAFIRRWSEDDYEYAQELKDEAKRFQLFIEKGIDFDQISNDEYYRLLCGKTNIRKRHDIYQAIVNIRNNSDEYGTSSFSRQTAPPMSNTFHPSRGFSPYENSNELAELKAQLTKMVSELEAQLNQMESDNIQLGNTSAALRSTINQLREENQNLEESLANERRARSASRGRKNKELEEAKQREASLREQLQQAQDELDKKTSKGLLGFVGKKEKPKERGRSPTRRHILK